MNVGFSRHSLPLVCRECGNDFPVRFETKGDPSPSDQRDMERAVRCSQCGGVNLVRLILKDCEYTVSHA